MKPNMFKDKIYEDMDDVERIFEPFQSSLNKELSKFPDKIKLEINDIMQQDYWSGLGVDIENIIKQHASKLNLNKISKNTYILLDKGFFEFRFEDRDTKSATLDPIAGTMSHDIYLVKLKLAFNEQELEEERIESTRVLLDNAFRRRNSVSKSRLNEIADIYGATAVKSDRSRAGKAEKLISHLEEMIESKVLDIRDMDLHYRFIQWIKLYVSDGNLAALNNLTRIKIITHEQRPIYSIEEKEVR